MRQALVAASLPLVVLAAALMPAGALAFNAQGGCTSNADCNQPGSPGQWTCNISTGACVQGGGNPSGGLGGGGGIPVNSAGGIHEGILLSYLNEVVFIVNGILVPVAMAIAFVVFLWGVFDAYILNGGNPDKRAEGNKHILWGLIGFFVLLCLWGLVALVGNTLGLSAGVPTPPPPLL